MVALEVKRFGQLRRDGLDVHAQEAAHNLAVLDQAVGNVVDHVRRDGETDALEAAAAA
ncbi:hypothetical protein D3C83_168250 [compost metagenome]